MWKLTLGYKATVVESKCKVNPKNWNKGVCSHYEEELWKLKYNFTMRNITFKKNPLKETQNPSRSYNSITNLKFPTQAQISSFKNPHLIIIIIDLLFIT
jgi:hypothetical protein